MNDFARPYQKHAPSSTTFVAALRANNYQLASTRAQAQGGQAAVTLALPDRQLWKTLIARIAAVSSNDFEIGTQVVTVPTAP